MVSRFSCPARRTTATNVAKARKSPRRPPAKHSPRHVPNCIVADRRERQTSATGAPASCTLGLNGTETARHQTMAATDVPPTVRVRHPPCGCTHFCERKTCCERTSDNVQLERQISPKKARRKSVEMTSAKSHPTQDSVRSCKTVLADQERLRKRSSGQPRTRAAGRNAPRVPKFGAATSAAPQITAEVPS